MVQIVHIESLVFHFTLGPHNNTHVGGHLSDVRANAQRLIGLLPVCQVGLAMHVGDERYCMFDCHSRNDICSCRFRFFDNSPGAPSPKECCIVFVSDAK